MSIADFLKIFLTDFAKLSLRNKILVTIIGIVLFTIAASIFYPDAAAQRLSYISHWWRAIISQGEYPPIDASTRSKLKELRLALREELRQELRSRDTSINQQEALEDGRYNSWTLSQLSLALPADAKNQSEELLQRIEHWRHHDGIGYKEFPDDETRRLPISAWCIWAKLRVYDELDSSEADFLLDEQDRDGWWGVYSGTADPMYASTYATSMSLIALSEVLSSDDVTAELRRRCKVSVRRASDWLKTNKDGPLWKDYPNHSGNVVPGHTGVALFALHKAHEALGDPASEELKNFDQRFLSSLSQYPAMAESSEVSGFTVENGRVDHVRVYIYPAILLGIASAYKNARISDRAKAADWLGDATDNMLQVRENVSEYPWVAAEYVIAIDRLLNHH